MNVRAAIRESLRLLTSRDRRLLLLAIAIQMLSSLLDLAGVLLLGLVGALAVTTIQSQPPPLVVTNVADTFGLGGLSDQALVAIFAAAAAALLLIKTAFSALLTRRVFIFLANRQARVSAELARFLLGQPLTYQQRRSTQEAAYALIQGAGAATLAVLGQTVIFATEAAVLVVLGFALLFVDPLITAVAIGVFLVTALVLQRLTGRWASNLGKVSAEVDIDSLNVVQDALSTFREIVVLNRRQYFVNRFQSLRWQAAQLTADRTFLLQIPKYVFETALVVGGGIIAGVLFLTQDSVVAIGTLALFVAAASRVMPSLLRMQSASLTLRDNAAAAHLTYDLAAELRLRYEPSSRASRTAPSETTAGHVADRAPGIEICGVSFRYPEATDSAVTNVSMSVGPGTSLAIVGRSGSGKSTLADLILGVLTPSDGEVLIDGVAPSQVTARSPGLIGYVPQDVSLIRGTARSNVALGIDSSNLDDGAVWVALERAHLHELFKASTLGLDTQIGERGVKLSGGQRQRLGIARALLSEPRLLVMDEATSSLDAETEQVITEAINSLHGTVTIVVVAHRLSTVRNSDQVAYLDSGHLAALGTFSEVMERVPALARQSALMGIR